MFTVGQTVRFKRSESRAFGWIADGTEMVLTEIFTAHNGMTMYCATVRGVPCGFWDYELREI